MHLQSKVVGGLGLGGGGGGGGGKKTDILKQYETFCVVESAVMDPD